MPLMAATHSGPFHADDVLAWALIRIFHAPDATLVRTRDAKLIKACDLVFDVGGKFDPAAGRFDHHQASYTGEFSSAGMVLSWLMSTGEVGQELGATLRRELVDYVDAIDTGRRAPDPTVPCFAKMVEAHTHGALSLEGFDEAFHTASRMAEGLVRGLQARIAEVRSAEAAVLNAMNAAADAGSAIIYMDAYHKWKPVYFAHGGADHPTEFVLFPGMEGTWRIVAIPPRENSFDQKRSLPLEWAGLTGSSLAAVTGVQGSLFCHKNRFIAVFTTRDGAVQALKNAGMG